MYQEFVWGFFDALNLRGQLLIAIGGTLFLVVRMEYPSLHSFSPPSSWEAACQERSPLLLHLQSQGLETLDTMFDLMS